MLKRLAMGLVLLGLAVAGCGEGSDEPATATGGDSLRPVGINGAQLFADGRLVANLNVCNADENTVEVSEGDGDVQALARTGGPVAGDECSDGIEIPLDSPLGDRALIDGTTGVEVQVDRDAG